MNTHTHPPPIIFLAFANAPTDSSQYLRNLAQEQHAIRDALRQAERSGICQTVFLPNANIEEVSKVFSDPEYKDRIAIFHFSGHANTFALQLDQPYRERVEFLHANGFASFLGQQENLKAVFLNACTTMVQARLIQREGVPCVIATVNEVEDATAKEMAVQFYRFLGAGNGLSRAFQEAESIVVSRGWNERDKDRNASLWRIEFGEDLAELHTWNLPDAVQQPLYGLPDVRELPLPGILFPGNTCYTESFARVFKGRDVEIREVYKSLTAKQASLILLRGNPGVGMSSLLQAGLIPRLRQQHEVIYWEIEAEQPLQDIVQCMAEHSQGVLRQEERLTIYLIDGWTKVPDNLPDPLVNFLNTHPQSRVLVTMKQELLGSVRDAISNKKVPYQEIYLAPLSYQKIRKIIHFFEEDEGVQERFGIRMEEGFADRLAAILKPEETAIAAPFFQFLLSQVWETTFRKNPRQQNWFWEVLRTLIQNQFWENWIEDQLDIIDPDQASSGLFLYLLYMIAERNEQDQPIGINQLKERFPTYEQQLPIWMNDFQQQRLILPATDDTGSIYFLLGHELLKIPIYTLLQKSYRPAQQADKLFRQSFEQQLLLDPQQLSFIQTNQIHFPVLSQAESDWLRQQAKRIEIIRKRKKGIFWFKFVSIGLLLGASTFFDNAYFLLFLILVFLLYK